MYSEWLENKACPLMLNKWWYYFTNTALNPVQKSQKTWTEQTLNWRYWWFNQHLKRLSHKLQCQLQFKLYHKHDFQNKNWQWLGNRYKVSKSVQYYIRTSHVPCYKAIQRAIKISTIRFGFRCFQRLHHHLLENSSLLTSL
jgi:hypothetical protein